MKMVTTLLRGAASEAEEALFDANAIRVLEQQLRDAAGSLEHARRELACAMAHQASEERAVSALEERIGALEAATRDALDAAREDLATEVATVIAATEDERTLRKASVEKFAADVRRLKQLSEDGRLRLADLRRGLEMARAQEALRRAGANGRQALSVGTGALRQAEATLVRIRDVQAREEDVAAALDELDSRESGRDLTDRLAAAGFGSVKKTNPADVLARLKASAGKASDAEPGS
ncbi:MAG: PspA/IM30 family protein [Hyphomicrobium sp.]|nr:PspA/IM30 family protein [Hyphomicrobium sp.]